MVMQKSREFWRQRRRQFHRVCVELTQDEFKRFSEAVRRKGATKSGFIREIILRDVESPDHRLN